jgi:hypothetical protein
MKCVQLFKELELRGGEWGNCPSFLVGEYTLLFGLQFAPYQLVVLGTC